MAAIPLREYLAFCLTEVVKARETVDAYSRAVAERYAADAVMRHFPAPRYRVASLQLSIPVIVTDARMDHIARFSSSYDEFEHVIFTTIDTIRHHVAESRATDPPENVTHRPSKVSLALRSAMRELYEALVADPLHGESILEDGWPAIVRAAFEDQHSAHHSLDHGGVSAEAKPVAGITNDVLDFVHANTVVDRNRVETLLIDPQTSVVKNGSTDSSVFTIRVDLVEEGVYIRSIQDEQTKQVKPLVEFE